MTTENEELDDNGNPITPEKDSKDIVIDDKDESQDKTPTTEELIQQGIDAALSPIKEKLDNAFAARDDALAKVAAFETKERERELARLEEEGKHKEVYELKLAEEKAKVDELKKTNTELTRNMAVKGVLAGYEFRSVKASEMAFRDITETLVQDANGVWVHKSGDSIDVTVKAFLESPDNEFLLKPKRSSGGQLPDADTDTSTPAPKSISNMTQAEVLKIAEGGNLRKRK